MPKRSLRSGLSSAQRHLDKLQEEINEGPSEKFAAELMELQASLAELEVAYEELEQQNDELLSTREALEIQRHRYQHLFDEAPFGYLVTDLNGMIEEANREAASLVGVPYVHLPGKPFNLFLDAKDRPGFRRLIPRVCAGESPGDQEVKLKRRDGETVPVVLTAVRDLDDEQRTARLRWTIRDVSRTKAAEEALRSSEERLRHSQRMESVGRLAGGIAHSFNNLLAAIAFQCELLDERLDAGDARRAHVDEIQKAGERAATLAHQLLAFGRRQVLQPRVLGLNDVLSEMEPMLRRLIGEHIKLDTQLAPEAGSIHVDLGQLEQVILNLVVNAHDAMPGGGCLTLGTSNVEVVAGSGEESPDLHAGSYVQLTVTDTGSGMSPEVLDHLFEPFYTTKERGKGTGLGLSTVNGIVYQSGGHIRVETESGKGTRFFVLLPRAGNGAEPEARLARPLARQKPQGSEVVLLVEDEDNIREPAVEVLQGRGYQVLASNDATQALALSDNHPGPIHILVTDVVMPGRSGDWLAEQLAARRPGIRILFISGYPEDSIAHHGVLAPTQHFLQKPFPPGRFLEKVREVLGATVTPDQTAGAAP
ncbi:MAG TPA: ATP-binding protein [Thermoanaerobaculia bacterium]|nr:ATP-binding protein [Thermoanaerobaculia bacterium]